MEEPRDSRSNIFWPGTPEIFLEQQQPPQPPVIPALSLSQTHTQPDPALALGVIECLINEMDRAVKW